MWPCFSCFWVFGFVALGKHEIIVFTCLAHQWSWAAATVSLLTSLSRSLNVHMDVWELPIAALGFTGRRSQRCHGEWNADPTSTAGSCPHWSFTRCPQGARTGTEVWVWTGEDLWSGFRSFLPGPHTCCLSCTAAPHPSLAFLLHVHSEDTKKVVPSFGEIGFLLVINYRTSSFYISHAVFMVRYVDLKICVGCNTKMSHF